MPTKSRFTGDADTRKVGLEEMPPDTKPNEVVVAVVEDGEEKVEDEVASLLPAFFPYSVAETGASEAADTREEEVEKMGASTNCANRTTVIGEGASPVPLRSGTSCLLLINEESTFQTTI